MRGDFYQGEKLDEKVNDWTVTAQKRLDTWWCRRQVSHCGSKKSDNRLIPQSPANPTLGREFASGRHQWAAEH